MKYAIAFVACLAFAAPAIAGPHHRHYHGGGDNGLAIGLGIFALGALGAAAIAESNRRDQQEEFDRRCLLGYDRYGHKVYDQECFE